MNKFYIFVLITLSIFLSACGAEDSQEIPQFEFTDQIRFNFKIGSFNDAQPDDLLYGIHDYKREFYSLYELAKTNNVVSKDLTVSEKTAYDLFFDKLELLDKHEEQVFELDSNELKSLFEANSIEIEAIDIFTFNSIKNVFDTISEQSFRVSNQEYLEIILDRNLTQEEVNAFEDLYEINNNLSSEYYQIISIDLELEDYIAQIENVIGSSFNEDQKQNIEIAYNIIKSIK